MAWLDRPRDFPDQGAVALYSDGVASHGHENATQTKIAEKLAQITGREFRGRFNPRDPGSYLVPNDTIVGIQLAHSLGITTERDLFGGVVPYPFVATKAISHGLVHQDAQAPPGWSFEFGRRTAGSVLSGFSAFSMEDATCAGLALLERGPVRLKPTRANGGRGQIVVSNAGELEAGLQQVMDAEPSVYGVVLEENLTNVVTFSIGQVRVADLLASYYGRQRLARDRNGETVYGGSDLTFARGDYCSVLKLAPPEEVRHALEQAQTYDAAATDCYSGLIASRRNYDVAQGLNSDGRRCSGVLEQSWRLGGASTAELAALEALRLEPRLIAVRASCYEVHEQIEQLPSDAIVYFHGVDDQIGPMAKYATVEPYAYT